MTNYGENWTRIRLSHEIPTKTNNFISIEQIYDAVNIFYSGLKFLNSLPEVSTIVHLLTTPKNNYGTTT